VKSFDKGALVLAFGEKRDLDAVDKVRKEVEEVVSAVMAQPVRIDLVVETVAGPNLVRSEVSAESDALAADKKRREAEARQHPLIQKAQDVFNASLKEVKTP
jgi:hypothetical protein